MYLVKISHMKLAKLWAYIGYLKVTHYVILIPLTALIDGRSEEFCNIFQGFTTL